MVVILEGDARVIKLLQENNHNYPNSTEYIKSIYSFELQVSKGMLFFNYLTKELLLLEDSSIRDFYGSDFAKEHFFSIPTSVDEYKRLKSIREHLFLIDSCIESLDSYKYTIFTTTLCNAHCFYCFERGTKKRESMSVSSARKVSGFILNRVPKKPVEINWFGGEPLLNIEVINSICDDLREAGLTYHSTITTNGILLTEKTLDTSKDWNLQVAQITIDGIGKYYNKVKSYSNIDKDPFSTIIQNIHSAIHRNIRVNLRFNIGPHNYKEAHTIAQTLCEEFREEKNINIYPALLDQRIDGQFVNYSKALECSLYDTLFRVMCICSDFGFKPFTLEKKLPTFNCNPHRNRELTILPDMSVGLCECYLDDHFIGDLSSYYFNNEAILRFRKKMPETSECHKCLFYPDYLKLEMCNCQVPWCNETIRTYKLRKLKKELLHEYDKL